MEILWYPALPTAKPLPFPCSISNPFWERDQYVFTDGTLPLDTVVPTGKPQTKPGTGRGHVCGTPEDFEEGGHYDPLAPAVTYGAQGLPSCCGAPGGTTALLVDGGRAAVSFPFVFGIDCPHGPPLPEGEVGHVTLASSGEAWAKVVVTAGVHYRFHFTVVTGFGEFVLFQGADCATKTFFAALFGTGFQDYTPISNTTAFLELFGSFSGGTVELWWEIIP